MAKGFVRIGFAPHADKLEFDVIIIRRAYVMTPPPRREFPIGWLNGKWLVHTVGLMARPRQNVTFSGNSVEYSLVKNRDLVGGVMT